MKCPYCEKQMEKGYIYNGRKDAPLYWLPEDVKLPFLSIFSKEKIQKQRGLVFDGAGGFIRHSRMTAHICKSCGKGMFDI
jgi:hypothetical protein